MILINIHIMLHSSLSPPNGKPSVPSSFGTPSSSRFSPGAISLIMSGGGWPYLWCDGGGKLAKCQNLFQSLNRRDLLLNILHQLHELLNIFRFTFVYVNELLKAFVLL